MNPPYIAYEYSLPLENWMMAMAINRPASVGRITLPLQLVRLRIPL
jgi:hypothetical protein